MNGPNAVPRSKRKEPPNTEMDGRHPKHHRLNANGALSSGGENTPDMTDELEGEFEEFDDGRLQAPLLPGGPDTAEWQATIENVVRNVVSIRFCQTCSFDTDPAVTSEATGFVVDAERG
jgi:pro-apoptotic serine protease NMA111